MDQKALRQINFYTNAAVFKLFRNLEMPPPSCWSVAYLLRLASALTQETEDLDAGLDTYSRYS